MVAIDISFRLKIKHSHRARQQALQSIERLSSGRYAAKIGGVNRGKPQEFMSRAAAERAIHQHYNEHMWRWLMDRREREE